VSDNITIKHVAPTEIVENRFPFKDMAFLPLTSYNT